ncbi:hypothetical protein ACFRLW_30885, partial [Streptomyces sp. NPDC056728]
MGRLGQGRSGNGPALGTLGRGPAVDACLDGCGTCDIARAHGVPVPCDGRLEIGAGRATPAALPGF